MNHVPSHGPGWVVEWGVVHSLAGDPRLPTFITHMCLFLLTDPEGKLLRLRNFTGEAITCSVAQSCPTLYDHMDCSLPGPSVHGDSPDKNTGVGCHAFLQAIFPVQGSNPGLLQCRWILYQLSHQGSLWSTRASLVYHGQRYRPSPSLAVFPIL